VRVPLKVYSDTPRERRRMITRDVVAVLLILFFAWSGTRMAGLVDGLQVLADGVVSAGSTVQDGFGTAADTVDDIPMVGGSLADGLRSAGSATGGNAVDLGRTGQETIHRLALVAGWLVFLLPTLVLLVVVLPRRLRRMRELGAASVVLMDVHDPERRRLLATRAALGLPYRTLARYTHDPLGDLVSGRHDALVAAALDEAGVRPAA
jgi:hypothetical protein